MNKCSVSSTGPRVFINYFCLFVYLCHRSLTGHRKCFARGGGECVTWKSIQSNPHHSLLPNWRRLNIVVCIGPTMSQLIGDHESAFVHVYAFVRVCQPFNMFTRQCHGCLAGFPFQPSANLTAYLSLNLLIPLSVLSYRYLEITRRQRRSKLREINLVPS